MLQRLGNRRSMDYYKLERGVPRREPPSILDRLEVLSRALMPLGSCLALKFQLPGAYNVETKYLIYVGGSARNMLCSVDVLVPRS